MHAKIDYVLVKSNGDSNVFDSGGGRRMMMTVMMMVNI